MGVLKPTALRKEEAAALRERAAGMLKGLGLLPPRPGFFCTDVPRLEFRDLTRGADEDVDLESFKGRVEFGASILSAGWLPFPGDPFHLTVVRWGREPDQCGRVRVGASTTLSAGGIVSYVGVTIGENVLFGPNSVMMDCDGSPADPTRPPGLDNLYMAPIVIGDNVWIGWNALIMPGVTIGHHSTVGALSVVTQDVPPHCLAVGNPARIIRDFSKDVSARLDALTRT